MAIGQRIFLSDEDEATIDEVIQKYTRRVARNARRRARYAERKKEHEQAQRNRGLSPPKPR